MFKLNNIQNLSSQHTHTHEPRVENTANVLSAHKQGETHMNREWRTLQMCCQRTNRVRAESWAEAESINVTHSLCLPITQLSRRKTISVNAEVKKLHPLL